MNMTFLSPRGETTDRNSEYIAEQYVNDQISIIYRKEDQYILASTLRYLNITDKILNEIATCERFACKTVNKVCLTDDGCSDSKSCKNYVSSGFTVCGCV